MSNANHSQPYKERTIKYTPRHSAPHPYKKPNAFLSFLLCLLATVSIFAFAILLVIRSANIGSVVRHVDVPGVLGEIEVSYYLINQINGLNFHDTWVDYHDVGDFITSDAVADEIGNILTGYATAFVAGNLDHHLTSDDIVNIARNLEPELYELFDHRLTEENLEHLARTLDDVVDLSSFTVADIIDEVDFNLTVPLLLLSSQLLWGAGILSALLLLVIFLLRKRKMSDAFLAIGIPVLLAGLLSFAIGLFLNSFPESLSATLHTITGFFAEHIMLAMRYGLTITAVGAVISLVGFVAKSIAPKVPH